MGMLSNDSILFKTSNRTSFLLGGWPEGAQVTPLLIMIANTLNSIMLQNSVPLGNTLLHWTVDRARRLCRGGVFLQQLIACSEITGAV